MTGSEPVPRRTGIRQAGVPGSADETPAASADETPAATAGPSTHSAGRAMHGFAHASEAELARILDFYDVSWRYEPDTFPIGWNLDGEVVESFSPDFYLPDLDLYVELTTLKQKLVRKKNRKLRRLRELYPDVRIKLFYARDFRMLLLKFGRMALVEELTGTTGQATPPRSAEERREASAAARHGPPARTEALAAAAAEPEVGVAPAPAPARSVPLAEQRGRRRGRRRHRASEPATRPAASAPESATDAT